MSKIVSVLLFLSFVGFFSLEAREAEEKKSVLDYRVSSQLGIDEPVLNEIFAKNEKIEVTLGGAWSPYSNYFHYFSGQLSVVYHMSRHHAIEPLYLSMTFPSLGSFVPDEVVANSSTATGSNTSVAIPKLMAMVSYQYIPYYSKMHITEKSVMHFDAYLGIGVGGVQTVEWFADDSQGEEIWRVAGSFSLGMRILFGSRWTAKLEVRDFIHQTTNFNKTTIGNTLQTSLSIGMFFGRFPRSIRGI